MKYIVFAPMKQMGEAAHVHSVGCQDVNKPKYRREERNEVEADNPINAALDILNGDELGYTEQDIKVFPCCNSK